jgi:hypothetical protein
VESLARSTTALEINSVSSDEVVVARPIRPCQTEEMVSAIHGPFLRCARTSVGLICRPGLCA